MKANDNLRSLFVGAFIKALLDTFQNNLSMVEYLVPIDAFPKKVNDTVINSETNMDNMKSNISRLVVAGIKKRGCNAKQTIECIL